MIGGVGNANTTLMAGFTSVRNVGAPDFMDVALKTAIDPDELLGLFFIKSHKLIDSINIFC
jgi:hypothetical protein